MASKMGRKAFFFASTRYFFTTTSKRWSVLIGRFIDTTLRFLLVSMDCISPVHSLVPSAPPAGVERDR